jgi:CHAD domain-containing protein
MSRSTTTFVSATTEVAAVVAGLSCLGYEFGPVHAVESALLDTFDGRLHRAGLELELRDGDDARRVVLAGRDVIAAELPVGAVPRFADDLPRGAFRDRLAAVVGIRALIPLIRLHASRCAASLYDADGKSVATVTVHADPRLVTDPEIVLASTVVELGELVGYPGRTENAADALERIGLERSHDTLLTIAASAAHVDLAGSADSPTVDLDPRMPLVDGFRVVLANLADTAVANWQGTIDRVDTEFLHDLRVAIRRTRTVLAAGKHVLPTAIADAARANFGGLGALTGPARDLDVYLLEWDSYTAPLGSEAVTALAPVRAWIAHERDDAYRTLAAALRSTDETSFVAEWRTWLRSTPQPRDDDCDEQPLGPFVARRIARAQSKLIDDGRLIGPESPAEQVHDLRKEAKKLRYLLECFGSLLAPRPLKQFVRRLKTLQDNLGEHQDAEVHIAELRTISHHVHDAGAGAATMIAIGQLTERLDRRRLDARAEFAARFAAYDTPATNEALHEALSDISR